MKDEPIDSLSDWLGDEKLRFYAVDDSGRQRTSDWILWESNDSVYLSTVGLSGILKLSIHPRGSSKDGYDTQFGTSTTFWKNLIRRQFQGNVPFARWRRPDPNETQISLVASVSFPTNLLHNVVEDRKLSGRKLAFPLPKAGLAIEIALLNHKASHTAVENLLISAGYTPIVCFYISDGERISVTARHVEFPHTSHDFIKFDRSESNWIGENIEVGATLDGAHAIVIHKWPHESEPLLLAEVNGFSLTRNR